MFKTNLITLAALILVLVSQVVRADDTEIYGTTSASVQPNVLIIMDNSGSMKTQDVPGDPYDPAIDYALYPRSGYTPLSGQAVYYQSRNRWYRLTTDVENIPCDTIKDPLKTLGYTPDRVYIRTSNLACAGSSRYYLKLGNFFNYERSTIGGDKYRWEVARESISRLVRANDDKRFGLMLFNSSQGGYVRFPCGTLNTTIADYLDNMTDADFNTWTPLAETLAEAGRYFGGMSSWFNSGVNYTSPIQETCQKNYIIYMTDGEPTQDIDSRLWRNVYMNGLTIGDYDQDGDDFDSSGNIIRLASDGSRLLDDVAKFLYEQDVHPMGAGTAYVKQNIITHTIGFRTDQALLSNAARNGGGAYHQAQSSSGLDAAFVSINNSINETSAVFLAPAVPVNRASRTEQSDWLYLAFFKPQNTGEWLGNIKKYALGPRGEVFGMNPMTGFADTSRNVIDQYGQIMDNTWSFWTSTGQDGSRVDQGGLGERMDLSTTPRTIYMLTGTNMALTAVENAFTTTNTAITQVDNATITAAHDFTPDWKLGAIIHSEPAIVHYASDQSVIYVGANDGMLHCFDDATGDELWAFVPPGQADRLTLLSDANKDYYVDGSPAVTYGDRITGTNLFAPESMIVGERRGGDNYYVMDISNYLAPRYKYTINAGILSGQTLGQSWCKPIVATIATDTSSDGSQITAKEKVFIIAGGYDNNQDLDTPAASDSVGKAIISVKTADGTLSDFIASPSTVSTMNHCIVDVNTDATYHDSDGSLITTRVYAGDLGGKVFVFADDITYVTLPSNDTVIQTKTPSGDFETRFCLFNAQDKKIFYAPKNSRMRNSRNEWVVFGTGDRESPSKTSVQNGIYAVKNDWLSHNLTAQDLYDATANLVIEGTDDDERKDAARSIVNAKGWYVNFYDPGEKLTSRPIIVQDYVFFTTYVPASSSGSTDPCLGGPLGVSYLWSIRLKDGAPIKDRDDDGIKEAWERRTQVAVMAQPTLISEDKISTPMTEDIPTNVNFNYFFWRQL